MPATKAQNQKRSTAAKHADLITIAQAAERYSVHITTIRRWIAAGTIKAYKLGPRIVRLDVSEIEAALMRPIKKERQAR
jgi:excisionase family DNA binding protein